MSVTRDRQQLWMLENWLAVSATTGAQRDRRARLRTYLNETCEHEWSDASGWGGSPRGTHQCNWCHDVLSPDEWRDLNRSIAASRTAERKPEPTRELRDPAQVINTHLEEPA